MKRLACSKSGEELFIKGIRIKGFDRLCQNYVIIQRLNFGSEARWTTKRKPMRRGKCCC